MSSLLFLSIKQIIFKFSYKVIRLFFCNQTLFMYSVYIFDVCVCVHKLSCSHARFNVSLGLLFSSSSFLLLTTFYYHRGCST